ncbi:MAG: phosphatase PAP2 family protein [Myxococcota bacterium]
MSRFSAFLERQNKVAIASAATLVHGLLYLLPNHLRLVSASELPLTTLDRWIPFVPQTAWIYWSDYFLIFVAFSLCRSPGSTARFVYALFTVIAIGTGVHWLWPVEFPRHLYPLPLTVDALTAPALSLFRQLDSPGSCVPSLHVAASFIAAFAARSENARAGLALTAWAALIALSTLTLKQHYVIDVVTGVALAAVVRWGFYRPRQGTR